jgi:pyridoxal phosphate enzyme (YggS family)
MRAGRNPEEVRLVAVTKTVDASAIEQAIAIGLRVFGESRVQEARDKIERFNEKFSSSEQIGKPLIEWHLIGHLQRNKAKHAVGLFDLIHTIDSFTLASEISRQAEKTGKIQKVLVQVKISAEESKHGVHEQELLPLLQQSAQLPSVRVEGLMCMPPFFESPEHARPYFRKIRALRDTAAESGYGLRELSMGMSHDFEVAIEEGATLVRIGSAIFGERNCRQ